MNLKAAKSVSLYGCSDHRMDSPGVASRVDPSKADETRAMGRHQLSQFPVGDGIIGMRGRQYNSAVDTGSARPTKIGAERRRSPPWLGQQIALTGMTMGVDDQTWAILSLDQRNSIQGHYRPPCLLDIRHMRPCRVMARRTVRVPG